MIDLDKIKPFARKVVESYDADLFMYSGGIEDDSLADVASAVVAGSTERERCILILTTYGGSANGAFQIARFFQKNYREFLLYCPGSCKSAGTLVALGAHSLIMDFFSELGPLDVQIAKEDELFARKSGLLATSTFEALADQTFKLYENLMYGIKFKSLGQISFRLDSQLAADMTANTMGGLYSQMNPDVIGSERRSLLIAKRYGQMLSAESENTATGHTVDHLVSCYPSHDFVIDDTEARNLFKRVYLPSEELYELTGALGSIVHTPATHTFVQSLNFPEDGDHDLTDADDGADPKGASSVAEDGGAASGSDEGGEQSGSNDAPKNPRTALRAGGLN